MSAAKAANLPSPALSVVNREGSLAVVDAASNLVVASIGTGDGPRETVPSSDGKLAFVLRNPHGLAFAGGKLYFTAETNKIVGTYDPVANQVDWLLGTGQNTTHMIEVGRNLDRTFTANISSNSIGIFKRSGSLSWNQTATAASP